MHPERHVSEMQDTCGIHVGYMYPERQSRYMLDTSTGIGVFSIPINRDTRKMHDEIHVERFVTEQATYTLAGPPELRWGNLRYMYLKCIHMTDR